jgi:VWFA-related protein
MPCVAAAIVLAVAGAAATPSAADQGPQGAPFRASTEVVEVDVVVQDRSGAFVTDLTLDDFELLEEGRPQRVHQLYLHLLDDQPAPSSRSAGAAVLTRSDAPRIFVVIFDDGHLSPGGFKRAQQAASELFDNHLRATDLAGVVVNGEIANDRLTSDRSELLAAVRDAKPRFISGSQLAEERQWPRVSVVEAVRIVMNADTLVLDDVVRRACTEDPDQCAALEGAIAEFVQSKALGMAEESRAQSTETLRLLTRLMGGLAGIEGRKSILLMSEGFMADASWPLVRETEGIAARANARIYTLDPRLAGGGGESSAAQLLQQMDRRSDPLNSLAMVTGGFAVSDANVLRTALAQISADAGNYYVLGYRPAELDGRFHELTVRVRRPGVSVRARAGYVASAAPAAPILGPITARPAEAVARPVEGIDTPDTGAPDPVVAADASGAPAGGAALPGRPDAAEHVEALRKDARPSAEASAGWEAYGRGEFDAAQSSLGLAAVSPSAAPWIPYALGHAQYALADYSGAVTSWERVIAAAPDFQPVYLDLADGYMQQDAIDGAERTLTEAAKRWPSSGDIVLALGVVEAWRGTLDEAIGLFEKAISLSPENAAAHFNLGKALELRYYGSRRYVEEQRQWVANEADREGAAKAYERCVALGGPFAPEAREGLARLEWMAK